MRRQLAQREDFAWPLTGFPAIRARVVHISNSQRANIDELVVHLVLILPTFHSYTKIAMPRRRTDMISRFLELRIAVEPGRLVV
jgi:hypothetical protein